MVTFGIPDQRMMQAPRIQFNLSPRRLFALTNSSPLSPSKTGYHSTSIRPSNSYWKRSLITFLTCICFAIASDAQQQILKDTTTPPVTDILDVGQRIFKIAEDTSESISEPSMSLLPVIGYNPSFGGVLGVNIVMGKQKGDPSNTGYSVYAFGVT